MAPTVPLAAHPTPFLLVDEPGVRQNISAMAAQTRTLGARLRPHLKCHRTLEIAAMQVAEGATGFTCATVAQCELLAGGPPADLLLASPAYFDSAIASRLGRVLANRPVRFIVDAAEGAAVLRAIAGTDREVDVLIEIDPGLRRTGVLAEQAGSLAVKVRRAGCRVLGVLSYPGGAYVPGRAQEANDVEALELAKAVASLEAHGFEPTIISAGSTPTMPFAKPGAATEYRPGTYVLGDCQQVALGSMPSASIAACVVATVISVHRDHVVIDAGGKALGRDAPPWLSGFGRVGAADGELITRLFDHHAVLDNPSRRFALGERVRVIPNNINSTVNLHSTMWLSADGSLAKGLAVARDGD